GTTNFISVPLFQPDEVTRTLRLRKRSDIESGLYGRVLAREVEVLGQRLEEGRYLTLEDVGLIIKAAEAEEIKEVPVRSPLTCQTRYGVC
ncbi:hypothetical protein ABTE48_19020, partial [Acinetobacter baumannii]